MRRRPIVSTRTCGRSALAGALLAALCACNATLPSYKKRTELWEEKDFVVVTVFLDEPVTAEEYVVIARREWPRLVTPPRHGVPVYEARFEFFQRGSAHPLRQRLARVTLVPGHIKPPNSAGDISRTRKRPLTISTTRVESAASESSVAETIIY